MLWQQRFHSYLVLTLLIASPRAEAASDAEKEDPKLLLEDADRARGGSDEGYTWQVSVESSDEGETSLSSYEVKSKGDNAHVAVTAPARSKGEVFLFNDRTIWYFKPGLRKPVAISARQKLSGQAANGDIASTRYARDYSGKLLGSETVNGEDCWLLELKAASGSSTYDGIRYWVSKKKRLGLKAEFLNRQGQAMKRATFAYQNSIEVKGKKVEFVSEMKIVDAQNTANVSVLTYTSPSSARVSESLFNVNNLLR